MNQCKLACSLLQQAVQLLNERQIVIAHSVTQFGCHTARESGFWETGKARAQEADNSELLAYDWLFVTPVFFNVCECSRVDIHGNAMNCLSRIRNARFCFNIHFLEASELFKIKDLCVQGNALSRKIIV